MSNVIAVRSNGAQVTSTQSEIINRIIMDYAWLYMWLYMVILHG